MVLLPDTEAEAAMAVAERMRDAVKSAPCRADVRGRHILSTVSIGMATYRAPDPADLDRLIAAADRAVYDAKRAGRDCVVAAEG